MKKYFDILYKGSFDQFKLQLKYFLQNNEKKFVITANPETFMIVNNDNEISKMILDSNTLVIPESVGIVKASKILGYNIKKRIPGVEVVEEILNIANKEKEKSLYLFGSKIEVIEKMEEIILKKYPNIKLLGAKDGYNNDYDEVFKDIILKQPDIILVALGIPKQEKLIYKYLDQFEKGIFIGVGGSFDTISGNKRAPKLFIKLNLEWLYRIIKEPRRFKRFYKYNIKFMLLIYKEKKKLKKI